MNPQTDLQTGSRPVVRGKAIFVGEKKLFVRSVTYGTFCPDSEGRQFPVRETVERDFALMAANEVNSVRTYTVPPRWLLDVAQQHGLLVMVGLPWEQHITFLSDLKRVRSIEAQLRESVRICAGHPAMLCYSIGNEIPSLIVRWHGRRRVEKFLEMLYRAAKSEDPEGLVTYVIIRPRSICVCRSWIFSASTSIWNRRRRWKVILPVCRTLRATVRC